MSFIECENLVKIYKIAELEVVALQGLDLAIEKGEMKAADIVHELRDGQLDRNPVVAPVTMPR